MSVPDDERQEPPALYAVARGGLAVVDLHIVVRSRSAPADGLAVDEGRRLGGGWLGRVEDLLS